MESSCARVFFAIVPLSPLSLPVLEFIRFIFRHMSDEDTSPICHITCGMHQLINIQFLINVC